MAVFEEGTNPWLVVHLQENMEVKVSTTTKMVLNKGWLLASGSYMRK